MSSSFCSHRAGELLAGGMHEVVASSPITAQRNKTMEPVLKIKGSTRSRRAEYS